MSDADDSGAEPPPTHGSDLLSNFLPADGVPLADAVDQFLARLDHLGVGGSETDDTPEYVLWPTACAAALISLEVGRRWRKRRVEGEPDDEPSVSTRGPGGKFAGWPGSWSVRVP